MFRWIIGSSLKYRFLIIAIAAAISVLGADRLRKMPVDVFPEYTPPIVEVQTEALGLSANEVESLISLNLEELLSGMPWLKSIHSNSVTGLSSIVMTFEDGTDLLRARQLIQERLTLAYTLPNVAKPPVMLLPVSSTSRVMMIGVTSKQVNDMDLSVLARWTVKPKLLGVPGVANVSIWGQRIKQMHVHIDSDRLRDFRVKQDDVISTAGDALWVTPLTFLRGSAPGTGGWIDGPNQRLGIQHSMPIRAPEDMAKLPVTPPHLVLTGKAMQLGEIAEITEQHPPMIGDAFVNGGPGLLLVVEKFPWANTLDVTRGVEAAIDSLRPGLAGVQIDSSIFRLANYIEESIGNVKQAGVVGAALAILFLFAFLLNWRTALISAVAVPLSVLAAVLVVYLSGSTLNIMIFAGLVVALAIVIDDVVVDVENMRRRMREARARGDNMSVATAILEGTHETRSVVVYGTVIVALAVLPVIFMGGLSGRFFAPLALTYILAVVASMVVAITVTPALSLVVLGNGSAAAKESPVFTWLRTGYENVLRSVTKSPKAIYAAAGGLVVVGLAVFPFLGQSLLPSLKERQIMVRWATPPGTSHAETFRITSLVNKELQAIPGVIKVGAHVGRAIGGDQIVGINSSQIWVTIDPRANYDATVAAIRTTVDSYPGMIRDVQTYLRDRISAALTGVTEPIVVRLFGAERAVLRQKADDVRQALSGIPGLVDLRIEGQVDEPLVQVKVDLAKAAQNGVKPGDVRRAAATVFSGLEVGYLFEEQKIYDVVVWSAPERRQSLADVRDVWVEKADGNHTRLGDVAEVGIVSTPTVIKHANISPYVDVVANVTGRDLGTINQEVERRLRQVNFPLEYRSEVLGEYAEQKSAQGRIFYIAIAAVIGIFLVLQACFGSWRLASIGFLALPAALAGGVLAAAAGGGLITLGSLVGGFAVLGLAARNSALLIRRYQALESDKTLPFGDKLVIRGASERLGSVLVSTVTITAAILPLILFGKVPGLEIVQPTAIVILGGLLASTLLTLFVVPPLYLSVGKSATRDAVPSAA
jgi:CzcA family heavy metal efflux pump